MISSKFSLFTRKPLLIMPFDISTSPYLTLPLIRRKGRKKVGLSLALMDKVPIFKIKILNNRD